MKLFWQIILILPFAVGVSTLFMLVSRKVWLAVLGGVLGVFLAGALMASLGWTSWLNLGESPIEAGLKFVLVFGWNEGIVGGLLGALVGGLLRKPRF